MFFKFLSVPKLTILFFSHTLLFSYRKIWQNSPKLDMKYLGVEIYVYLLEVYSVKTGLNISAKSIDPGQLAQYTEADLSGNFLPLVHFLNVNA